MQLTGWRRQAGQSKVRFRAIKLVWFAMTDYVHPRAFRARLRVGGQEWPVWAILAEVTSIRDRRTQIEGQLWAAEKWPFLDVGDVVELLLPDEHVEEVSIIQVRINVCDEPGGYRRLEAGFMSSRNLRT